MNRASVLGLLTAEFCASSGIGFALQGAPGPMGPTILGQYDPNLRQNKPQIYHNDAESELKSHFNLFPGQPYPEFSGPK